MNTQQMYDILDTTFRTLFNNMDKDGLHFEKQILWPNKIKAKPGDIGKLWDVLLATGMADSIIGFGNEGKLEITPAGIQMMTRYGTYKNFLASQQSNNQRQPQQLTIQLINREENTPTAPPQQSPSSPAQPAKVKKSASKKKTNRSK